MTTTAQAATKEENRTRELPFSILCPPSPVVRVGESLVADSLDS